MKRAPAAVAGARFDDSLRTVEDPGDHHRREHRDDDDHHTYESRHASPFRRVARRLTPLEPDSLAAEARRWTHGVTYSTDPRIAALVVAALRCYYRDTRVVEGIVTARMRAHAPRFEGGEGVAAESSGGEDAADPHRSTRREDDAAHDKRAATPTSRLP